MPFLEAFTFEKFKNFQSEWLRSGRAVWYVTGNIGSDNAIEIVEQAIEKLNLKTVNKQDLKE